MMESGIVVVSPTTLHNMQDRQRITHVMRFFFYREGEETEMGDQISSLD
jgi:hypothetical protein